MAKALSRRQISNWVLNRSGASAVEFALVAPLFILILIGIMTYGIYFGSAHSVQQLASEAARASIGGLDDAERQRLAESLVRVSLRSYPLIRPAGVELVAEADTANPDIFHVRVVYDSSDLVIWAFEGLLPLPPRMIVRDAAIRRGGY